MRPTHSEITLCWLLCLLVAVVPAATGGMLPASSAPIAATATVINPLGVAGDAAGLDISDFSVLAVLENGSLRPEDYRGLRLFYSPRPDDIIVRADCYEAPRPILLKPAVVTSPTGSGVPKTGVPCVSLLDLSPLLNSIPIGAAECVVTIISAGE